MNIDAWKALNTLNSLHVGVSRSDMGKMFAVWRACGARM